LAIFAAASGGACLDLLGIEEVGYGTRPDAAVAPVDANVPPDAPGCEAGAELCGGECVDISKDVKHCGACGRACTLCEKGQCQPEIIAFVEGMPEGQPELTYGVAVDDQYLYFSTIPNCGAPTFECNAPGRVLYKAKGSVGAPSNLIAGQQSWPEPLLASGGRVYWGSWSNENGGVRSSKVVVGAPSAPLTHFACTNCNLYSMAISGTDLFAAQFGLAIRAIDLRPDAGSGDAGSIVGVANNNGDQPQLRRVAVDADRVYWTVTKTGDIGAVRSMLRSKVLAGTGTTGDVLEHAALGGIADGLAVDDRFVYVASRAGVVVRVAKAGGDPETLAQGLLGTRSIVVDGDVVYVAGHDAGRVYALVRKGNAWTTLTLATGVGAPQDVTVDAEYVYFTGGSDAKVYRVRKPLVK
jgi:hypothetical protein